MLRTMRRTVIFKQLKKKKTFLAHRIGSDGNMSASGSASPRFNPRRGSIFSFENFQPNR